MAITIDQIGIDIVPSDWEATPASVQALVEKLSTSVAHLQQREVELTATISQLQERLAHLEEQQSQNSQNSSRPPSSDGFGKAAESSKSKSSKSKRKRGGQAGHPGHSRNLYPLEACDEVFDYRPESCQYCGEPLSGDDEAPYRHQVIELPPIVPVIVEHRCHQLRCSHCARTTRAALPATVSSGYGERLSGFVSLLCGGYRLSHQMVQQLLGDAFDISISSGSINRLRREMSEALRGPVEAAHRYVQQQPVLYCDETPFKQGNCDGHNPKAKQGYLWAIVTPFVSFFAVMLSRSSATAKGLIGQSAPLVVCDRYSSYNWLEPTQRQVCWAHLKRDLTAIAQRKGLSSEIGEALLSRQRRLFRWWYQVRDGTLRPEDFESRVAYLRDGFKRQLEAAAEISIATDEKTPLAKTVRTCRKLLKIEPALWTFVYHQGVEPTNNNAERGLRPAVIWKRISFGSQSKAGSEFVGRMMSVVSSLKAQNRNVLDYLTQTYRAHRLGEQTPSLIPQ